MTKVPKMHQIENMGSVFSLVAVFLWIAVGKSTHGTFALLVALKVDLSKDCVQNVGDAS